MAQPSIQERLRQMAQQELAASRGPTVSAPPGSPDISTDTSTGPANPSTDVSTRPSGSVPSGPQPEAASPEPAPVSPVGPTVSEPIPEPVSEPEPEPESVPEPPPQPRSERRAPDCVQYASSTEHSVTPEIGGGGDGGGSTGSVSTRIDPPPRRVSGEKKSGRSEYTQITRFPRSLIQFVRNEFPNATNNSDALAAYVYLKSGRNCEVADDIKTLADQYSGDKSMETISKSLQNLNRQMTSMNIFSQEFEFLLGYLLLDTLGFRQNNPRSADSADLLESELQGMISRMREQFKQYRMAENLKNGRPIR